MRQAKEEVAAGVMLARGALLAVLVVLTAGTSACARSIDCGDHRFSSRDWREAGRLLERRDDPKALKKRRRAADALVACRVLDKKTKRKVATVLGRPFLKSREENAWYYRVGKERGDFSVDEEVLRVKFVDGRVAKVSQEVG